MGLEVVVNGGDDLGKALNALKRKTNREGVWRDEKRHRHFYSRNERRRRDRERGRKKLRTARNRGRRV